MVNSNKNAQRVFAWADFDDRFNDESEDLEPIFDDMVARQVADYTDLSEPCPEALELLGVWTINDESCLPHWRAAVERAGGSNVVSLPVHPAFDPSATVWHDAELSGAPCEEWTALMNWRTALTFGRVGSAKQRDDTRDDQWAGTEITWLNATEGKDEARDGFGRVKRQAWGLARHVEDGHKGGPVMIFGACQKYRRAASVVSLGAVALDCDTGHVSFKDAVTNARERGHAFIAYTSHSHRTTETVLKYDVVVKHAACDGEPTLDQIKAFVADKKNLAPHIVQSMEVAGMREHGPDGLVIRVSHDPIQKFRLIFPLVENVMIADLANTQAEAFEIHKRKVFGLAAQLGLITDAAATDVSRAFFTARHQKEANYRVVVHRAPPLAYDDIPLANVDGPQSARKAKRERVVAERPDGDTVDVSALYERYAKRWMLAEIAEECDLATSANAQNAGGKFHIRCPFADGHMDSSDDTATVAINAEDSTTGYSVIKCQHASCQGRHLTEYLGALITSGGLDPALLEDAQYMSPVPDQGESRFLRLTPGETLGISEARAFLREHLDGEKIADGAEARAVALLEGMGVPASTARQRVTEAVCDVERQLAARTDRGAPDDSEAPASLPHVLDPLFDEELVDEEGFIVKPADAGDLYRAYGINTDNEDVAYQQMRLEIRDQIYRSMNARFDYVVLDGEAKIAIRPETGQRVRLWGENTLNKLYVNRGAKYLDDSGKTSKVVVIKPAEVFVNARQRGTFIDTCFEPDEGKAALAATRSAFNLWTGFAAIAEPGDWSLLRNHIRDILCGGDEDHFDFVMTFLASLFQRPGVKIPCALAFIGEQGTGKSKVFDWVRLAIGASALKVSSMRHLTGNFNAHLDGLILLVCEEAFWGGQKGEGGVLKDLISSETLQIEGKFQNVVERPNYVCLVFISNNAWIVPTDGKDARRFFVRECSDARKQDGPYFGEIDDQMENGGLEAMVHDLMHWDPACIGGWQALRDPPETEARRRQVALGLAGPAARLVAILEAGVLAGQTSDGDRFHYDLSDDQTTDVAKTHIVAALDPGGRGNITDDMKRAITTYLGADADHGDNKLQIRYMGEHRTDQRGETQRVIKNTEERVRYVTIPALSSVQGRLAEYGRGDTA
ncbi:MAG: primase-helicase family protein [Pseudomonadota bacterium]